MSLSYPAGSSGQNSQTSAPLNVTAFPILTRPRMPYSRHFLTGPLHVPANVDRIAQGENFAGHLLQLSSKSPPSAILSTFSISKPKLWVVTREIPQQHWTGTTDNQVSPQIGPATFPDSLYTVSTQSLHSPLSCSPQLLLQIMLLLSNTPLHPVLP